MFHDEICNCCADRRSHGAYENLSAETVAKNEFQKSLERLVGFGRLTSLCSLSLSTRIARSRSTGVGVNKETTSKKIMTSYSEIFWS